MKKDNYIIIADDIVEGRKKCSRCGSRNLSWGKFDSEHGTLVKCNECGNVTAINHQDFDHPSRKEII